MPFVSFTVGDPEEIFPVPDVLVRDFVFPQPVNSAQALLQGFDLQYDSLSFDGSHPDHHLKYIQVSLKTHFTPGDRAGAVEVAFILDDAHVEFVGAQIQVLVVGL
jgi:hypothetical protein